MELYENEEKKERVILVAVAENGIARDGLSAVEESLDELSELAETAGAEVCGRLIQNRESMHPGTYIGKGKIEELAEMLSALSADGIICDDELSPAQMKNLEDSLDTKVMDRTLLILDIFAQHASTKEGKIQVELAQLRYRSTRLAGFGRSMSRLGGGIGTRGPGEKKLEIDRRLIKDRIAQLRRELTDVRTNRDVLRKRRLANPVPVVAIVGYTNAGKSTLLNRLTGSEVLSKDMLFATLDPTTRNAKLENGQELLFTDTVGFIRKLPHHLVEAFRSTLEEARYADVILHVVDAAGEDPEMQMRVVYDTLKKLEIGDKPVLTAFNKQDKLPEGRVVKDLTADRTVRISALTGEGTEELLDALIRILEEQKVYVEKVFSYQEAGKIAEIRKYGQLLSEKYTEEGIAVKAYMPKGYLG